MKTKYTDGGAILNRIINFYNNSRCNYEDSNYLYAQGIYVAMTGGGYDSPIQEKELAKWLEEAYLKGKRITTEVDCEFLSGDDLQTYLKTHPHHVFKAGSRASQCDGWKYHCVIDQNSAYNSEVGF